MYGGNFNLTENYINTAPVTHYSECKLLKSNWICHSSNQNCLPKSTRYMAAPIQIFLLTISLTLAGLWPLIIHSFIDFTQSVAIDATDDTP